MLSRIIAFVFLSFLSFSSIAQIEWRQVWSDEFDYTGLPDSEKWSYDVGGNGFGNQELQYYTDARQENASVSDGMLTITARKEAYEGNDYTSARLITKGMGDWKYGKVTVRAKLPAGTGVWPAIWMLPSRNTYGNWPNSGEIDIMEYVGYDPSTLHFTIHTEAYNHTLGTQIGTSTEDFPQPYNSFHEYSLEWFEDSLKILVDGAVYFSYEKPDNATSAEWPFDQPYHLLLNIAVGGTWGGAQGVDDDIFPQTMEVDYVRVYKQISEPYTINICEATGGQAIQNPNKQSYTLDEQVTVTAQPDAGYEFIKWSGNTYSTTENPFTVNVFHELDLCPTFERIGELLENTEFTNGNEAWGYYGADAVNDGSSLCFDIPTATNNLWDIQLSQGGVPLEAGESYTFRFTSWSTENRSIKASLGLNEDPWTSYYDAFPGLTTTPEIFTYDITPTVSDPAARVVFDLGEFAGDVCFSNISLVSQTVTGTSKPYQDNLNLVNPVQDHIILPKVYDRVVLMNTNGKVIKDTNNTNNLHVQALQSGVYLLRLELDGNLQTVKVLKD